MRRCVEKYVDGAFMTSRRGACHVLDVGGADVNGSYRDLFDNRFTYDAADLEDRPDVSVVLDDPYRIPLDDRSVDLVLSGQMLEHCEFFWLQFREMMRVLRPDGYLFLIAPSAGPIHRYPVDCYRFYPDSYRALARDAGCHLIDVWRDERGPWLDLVGVFRHDHNPSHAQPAPSERQHATMRPLEESDAVLISEPPEPSPDPALERTAGTLPYMDVLAATHCELSPRLYVEIGVRNGRSLSLARDRAIGIDPAPDITVDLHKDTEVVQRTSDAFFDADAPGIDRPIDLAFIDGMHLSEFALRDFMNLERRMAPWGAIVIDDIFPNHPVQARRERETAVWTGDVWKLLETLRRARRDLHILTFDTRPTGLAVITGLNPANRVLWNRYNPIAKKMQTDEDPPEEFLNRSGAEDNLSTLRMLLLSLRLLRRQRAGVAQVRKHVARIATTAKPYRRTPA